MTCNPVYAGLEQVTCALEAAEERLEALDALAGAEVSEKEWQRYGMLYGCAESAALGRNPKKYKFSPPAIIALVKAVRADMVRPTSTNGGGR